MELVLLTALGVGGATIIGALIGFIFKKLSHQFSDIVLSFAAGVMLAAAVLGLILPSLEYGGKYGLLMTVAGIFVGAVSLNLIDRLVPHLHKLAGKDSEVHSNANLSKVLLFVMAIAIHNLPEGIAAGVGFGAGDTTQALIIAGGHRSAEYSGGNGHHRPHARRRDQAAQNLCLGNAHRSCGGSRYLDRLFCRQHFYRNSSLCPCICRRNDALCHQRRNDPRNSRPRKRTGCDLLAFGRLLRDADHGCPPGIIQSYHTNGAVAVRCNSPIPFILTGSFMPPALHRSHRPFFQAASAAAYLPWKTPHREGARISSCPK